MKALGMLIGEYVVKNKAEKEEEHSRSKEQTGVCGTEDRV